MRFGTYARKADPGISKEEMRAVIANASTPVTVVKEAVAVRKDMCQSKWVNIGGDQIARTETALARTLRILEEIKTGGKHEN